jgi:hypothetical protein
MGSMGGKDFLNLNDNSTVGTGGIKAAAAAGVEK